MMRWRDTNIMGADNILYRNRWTVERDAGRTYGSPRISNTSNVHGTHLRQRSRPQRNDCVAISGVSSPYNVSSARALFHSGARRIDRLRRRPIPTNTTFSPASTTMTTTTPWTYAGCRVVLTDHRCYCRSRWFSCCYLLLLW